MKIFVSTILIILNLIILFGCIHSIGTHSKDHWAPPIGIYGLIILIPISIITYRYIQTDPNFILHGIKLLLKDIAIFIMVLCSIPIVKYSIDQRRAYNQEIRQKEELNCKLNNVVEWYKTLINDMPRERKVYEEACMQVNMWKKNKYRISRDFLVQKHFVDSVLYLNTEQNVAFCYLMYQEVDHIIMKGLLGRKDNGEWKFYLTNHRNNIDLQCRIQDISSDIKRDFNQDELSLIRHYITKEACSSRLSNVEEIEKIVLGDFFNDGERSHKWRKFIESNEAELYSMSELEVNRQFNYIHDTNYGHEPNLSEVNKYEAFALEAKSRILLVN